MYKTLTICLNVSNVKTMDTIYKCQSSQIYFLLCWYLTKFGSDWVECLRYQTSYMHLSLPLINLSCYFYFPIDQKHSFTHISLSWVAWLICFLSTLNLFQENFFLHLHASDKAFDKGNIFVRLTWLVFSATNTALDVPLAYQLKNNMGSQVQLYLPI